MADDIIIETMPPGWEPPPQDPGEVPQAFLERLRQGTRLSRLIETTAKRFNPTVEAIWGGDPVGIDPGGEVDTWLRDVGIFPKEGNVSPLRTFNEALLKPSAAAMDVISRVFQTGSHGIAALTAAVAEEAGENEAMADRLHRDVAVLADISGLVMGAQPLSFSRIRRMPDGRVVDDEVARGLPDTGTFKDAGNVVRQGSIVEDVADEKLQRLWQERGLHPNEVAADAMDDPVVRQSMLSRGGDTPDGYGALPPPEPPSGGGLPPPGGRRPPGGELPPPEGPKPLKAEDVPDDAWAKVRSKISVGASDPQEKLTLDAFMRDRVDKLWFVGKEFKNAGLATADDPYRLARMFSGWGAKVDYFLNRRTYNFHTLEDVGPGLNEILSPVRKEFDEFRTYAAAIRARDLEKRNVATGIDAEAVRTVALEGEQKYPHFPETYKKLVNYQNEVTAYARDAGMISRKGYEAMLKANRYYLPFNRVLPMERLGFQVIDSGLTAKQAVHTIEGSVLDVVDPLETVIRNTAFILAQAEKNQVGQALIKAMGGRDLTAELKLKPGEATRLKRQPGQEVAEIGDTPDSTPSLPPMQVKGAREAVRRFLLPFRGETGRQLVVDAKTGKQKFKRRRDEFTDADWKALDQAWEDLAEQPPQDHIAVWWNGERHFHPVANPEIMRAWLTLDATVANSMVRFLSHFANGIRKGALWVPDFWGRHSFRDIWYAAATYKGEGTFTPLDTLKGLYHGVMGHVFGKSTEFDTWIKGGGGDAALSSLTRRSLQGTLDDIISTGLWTRAQNIVADPNSTWLQKSGRLVGVPFQPISKYVAHPLQVTTEIVMEANKLGAFMKRMRELDKDKASVGTPAKEALSAIPDDVAYRAIKSVPRENLPTIFRNHLRVRGGAPLQGAMKAYEDIRGTAGAGIMDAEYVEVALKASPEKRKAFEAAWVSRETSVDMARIGAKMRSWNMITAFLNARVQDLDVMTRLFKDKPEFMVPFVLSTITMPSLMLWWANKDDSRYRDLPQWQKDIFWIIPSDKWEPASASDLESRPNDQVMMIDGVPHVNNGTIWRVPKPFTLGIIFGSGFERLADSFYLEGGGKEGFKGFASTIRGAVIGDFLPTGVVPVLDHLTGRSTFRNTNMIPGPLEKLLPEYQYTPYTTELAKRIGAFMSEMPLLREAALQPPNLGASGLAQGLTSPIVIENYVRGWTGTLGTYVMQAADAGLRKAGLLPDPVVPLATLADIPFVKGFVIRYPSATTQSIQDFYDAYGRDQKFFNTWMAKAKEGDLEATNRVYKAGGPAIFARLDGIKQTLTSHARLIQYVHKNPDIQAWEKRQIIDGLYFNMIKLGQGGKAMAEQARRDLESE